MTNFSLDNKSVRIAVFGAGAVGKYISAKLAKAKISFDLIARGSRAALLKSDGLVVIDSSKNEQTYTVNVKESLEGKYDIIFLTVKSNDTLDAAITIKPYLSDTAVVVSLQNGVENPNLLSTILPPVTVVSTVIYVTAVNNGLNKLIYYSDAKIIYNNYIDDGNSISLLESVFNRMADVEATISKDIRKDQWRKLLFNITTNPLTALFGYTYTQLSEDKLAIDIARRIFDEALGAANILGIDFGSDEFDKILNQVRGVGSFKSSMLQDIEANRTPELDAILGAVGRVYRSKNLLSPNTDMLLDIMKVKYGGFFQTSPRLAADILVYHDRKVLLIERKNEPRGYAIPGGFVDMHESVETAAIRELEEETGIVAPLDKISLLGVYSEPSRDVRGRTVSVIYTYESKDEPEAADDALSAKYFDVDDLPEHMAFDHREVIRDFVSKITII